MALTQERRQQLDAIVLKMAQQNAPREDVVSIVDDFKSKFDVQEQKAPSFFSSTTPSFPASKTGEASDVPTNIVKTLGNIPSSARNLLRATIAPINPFDTENPLNIGANIVKGGQALYDTFKTAGYTGGIEAIAGGVADTLGKGRDISKGVVDTVSSMTPSDIADKAATVGIEDPLLIPSMLYTPSKVRGTGITRDAVSTIASPVTRGVDTSIATNLPKAKEVISEMVKSLTQKSEAQIESAIIKKFEKGVKPLLPAKTTPNLLENYREDIVSGVKTIKENKPNLKYADEIGNNEFIVGKSPETLQQMTDAIEQTKKTIFTKYNEATKQSGKAGLTIETAPISKELESVISNEALKISNPEAIKYAQDLQKRLANFDTEGNFIDFKKLDPSITQDVIQNYNKSLEAFYRNPTYDTASRAAIDAMVANKFRQALDEGVTSLTGTEYQVLKNQYGSLKAIERDVIKATLRDARKNVKGLIDFTDILSGGQVVSGLLTLNPATLAQGFGARAIKEFYKYLNNPNRAIKAMFQEAEKLPQSKLPNKNLNILSGEGKSLLQTQPATSISNIPNNNVIPPNIPQRADGVKGITKDLEPLAVEAKKYQSAEEFVKAQGTPKYEKELYRGTGGGSIVLNTPDAGNALGGGKYYTKDWNKAYQYGKNVETKNVKLNNPLKITSDQELTKIQMEAGLPSGSLWRKDPIEYKKNIETLRDYIEKKGHDGVIIEMENQFNSKRLNDMFGHDQVIDFEITPKTKSQLTDMWNKAKQTEVSSNPAFDKAHYELSEATAGRRAFIPQQNESTSRVVGIPSTFPKWLPEEVRSKAKIDSFIKKYMKDGYYEKPDYRAPVSDRKIYDALAKENPGAVKKPEIVDEINPDDIPF